MRHILPLAVWLACGAAIAHESLQHLVQLRITSTLHGGYLDTTLEITLHDELAARERGRMDIDQDGQISVLEKSTYLERMEARLDQQLSLFVNADETSSTPLYEPSAEFGKKEGIGPQDLTLRFSTFSKVHGRTSALGLTCTLFGDDPVLAEWEVMQEETGKKHFLARQREVLAEGLQSGLSRTIKIQLPRQP